MISLRMVAMEVSALGVAALSMPLRFVLAGDSFDPDSPHRTPVVLVHGLLGDPTNFLALRRQLALRGVHNVATFSYAPRIDYPRLAYRLGEVVEALCELTGEPEVDVVGHSMGGLVARYLVEMARETRVRRLVTLGSPYFASPLPARELAIFGASDPFIAAPHPAYGPQMHRTGGRAVVVPGCGHWGLLYHPAVLEEAAGFLCAPGGLATTLELEAAS